MSNVVNVHDLKTNYSKYLDKVTKNGEEVVLGKYGKPVAKLVPLAAKQRQPGILAGKIWIDEDFDDPMPELIAAMEADIDADTD